MKLIPKLTHLLNLIILISLASPAIANQITPARPTAGETPATQSPHRILVLGDSLSAAYQLPKADGWVALLEERLKQEAIAIDIENASVSGSTTAAGLQRLPSLLEKHKPHLVILELGANDGLQGKPLPYIQKNLSKLIELTHAANAKVLLLGIRLPPNMGKRYTEPFFAQYQTLANAYKLQLVPFMLEGVAGNPDLMKPDGIHPNKQGQEAVLEYLWPSLVEAIGK